MNFSNLLQFEMELKMETKLTLTKRHWAEASKAGRLATAYWAARPTGTGRWPLERETAGGWAGTRPGLIGWPSAESWRRLPTARSGTGKTARRREKGRDTGEPNRRPA
jgi:hypothetical protein